MNVDRMKFGIATAMLAVGCAAASPGWAQAAADTTAAPSNDPFVKQRDAIAAANEAYQQKVAGAQKTYDAKVDAASDVFDQKVADAKEERKKAVAAARGSGG
jgi:hypothetical protein